MNLSDSKKQKLSDGLKTYSKKFLSGNFSELDESGTRIMINQFLTDVLGFVALEEVKTEYMIKGTYADYVIQLKGERHFLVEVKALPVQLNENHLRQAINYGANEGIEYALLTNGRCFDFYKIIFGKPIENKKIFSLDLSDSNALKTASDTLQYLHKDLVTKGGLDFIWNRSSALYPENVAKHLLNEDVVCLIKKSINKMYQTKFDEKQIQQTIYDIIVKQVSLGEFKMPALGKKPAVKKVVQAVPTVAVALEQVTSPEEN